MTLRELGFYLRVRLARGIARGLRGRRPLPPLPTPTPLDTVLRDAAAAAGRTPLALARLLESRTNAEREGAVPRYLKARGVPFACHRFATFEGAGENFSVDVGTGDRVLVLVAHHDAVTASPGANDNAASVGILLHLLDRLAAVPPARVRVRLLFPAAEELGYLGSRAYVRAVPVSDVAGVLSLELCGIGDSLVLWDVERDTPFLRTVTGTLEGQGMRRDEQYHVVGRIPLFGSDHRAFVPGGIAAYGLTVVPVAEAAALREFIFRPVRGIVRHAARRPPPFHTYHTSDDALATVDPAALASVADALEAIVREAR
jgi:Zn-dependent M28 family amino/carboxypeptidase